MRPSPDPERPFGREGGPSWLSGTDREMLALALPALATLAADPLVSLVDTIFVGRLGVVPLAALGVNAAVFSLTFVVFNFLAYGTTPMVAREVGRGDREAAGKLALQALALAASLGVVVALLLFLLARPVAAAMGAAGALLDPTTSYMRVRALAGPAVLLVTAGHGIFRGHQDTRTPLRVTLGLNAVNLVLDPILIFGLGWGLEGAAWATVAAQWTGAAWFLDLILRRRRTELGVPRVFPAPRELWPFLRVGAELSIRTGALIGIMTLATAVATRVGTVEVAAHQVATQLWLLLALLIDPIAVAAQALVGKYRGAGETAHARALSNRMLVWGTGTGFGLALAFLAVRPLLPLLFTDDAAVIAAVDGVLPFVIWMQPLNGLVFVWDGIYLGSERFRFLAGQMVAASAGAATVLAFVLPMAWGLSGVWWGIVALMGLRALLLSAHWFGRRPLGRAGARVDG